MTPVSVLIVDDEPPARRTLRMLVEREPGATVAGEAGDGVSAAGLIDRVRPDILFLDVQMPGGTGFDVLARLGDETPCAVVFVTAFDRYALRAFEARALDYLLKPFTDERFAEVFARARRAVHERRLAGTAERLETLMDAIPRSARAERLVLREGTRTLVIPLDDIVWIEAEDYCVRVHTIRERPLIRRSLRDLLGELDVGRFVRVHRSAIVNLDHVRELRGLPAGDAELGLSTGVAVRVSRTHRADVATRLERR